SIDRNLAPTLNFGNEIIKELAKSRIILVNPQSSIDAFVAQPEDNDFPNVYYTFKVSYILNLNIHDNYYEEVSNIMNPKGLNDEDIDEVISLWKRIALEECLEYLFCQMKKVGFDFNAGEK